MVLFARTLSQKAASFMTTALLKRGNHPPHDHRRTPPKDGMERHETNSCRLCGGNRFRSFVDLGMTPLCESFLAEEHVDAMEPYYPLHALVCEDCLLVQLKQYVSPSHIFSEYAYFSSYSTSWVEHARTYCETIKQRFNLGPNSLVVEIASNDGYLLQHLLPLGIPVLGMNPPQCSSHGHR